MKTKSLQEAIDFVLTEPQVQQYIKKMEAQPNTYAIGQISATVTDYPKSIIRVFINFRDRNNPNVFKEDAIIDVQGTNATDFKIVHVQPFQG